MRNEHINKYGMYLVVITVLDTFVSLVALMPALVKRVASFKALVGDIGRRSQEVGAGTTGKTEAKRSATAEMISAVNILVGKLHAWAAESNKVEIMQRSDVSESDIRGVRDAERGEYAASLVKLVEDNKASLADFNVTDAEIAEAKDLIAASDASLGDRNETRSKNKGRRKSIAEMFAGADFMLESQIDRLVESYKKEHPDFVAEYQAARVIRDIAAGRGDDEEEPPAPGGGGTPPPSNT